MLLSENSPAWVRGVVDEQGTCLSINKFLQIIHVNIEVIFRDELVLADFNIQVLANGLDKSKAR